MKHEEFENQMFSCVNKNCKMKELDRQEIARAAQEEYRFVRKCQKIKAVIGIIVFMAFFGTIVYAMGALHWMEEIPAEIAIGVTAVFGLVFGMGINALASRIKN